MATVFDGKHLRLKKYSTLAISKKQYLLYLRGHPVVIHFPENTQQVLCHKLGTYFHFPESKFNGQSICEDCLTHAGEH